MHVSYADALKLGWVDLSEVPGPKARGARKKDQEGLEQAALIREFRSQFPQFAELLIHIPNGGSRKNAYEGWRLKEQGVRAGVSDLFLPVARGTYHGLWLEFKAAPPYDAAVSASQREWLTLMAGQGYAAHLCRGVPEALAVLSDYLNDGK